MLQTKAVQISDVTFEEFRGTTTTDNAIQLNCSATKGCTRIVLKNINMASVKPNQALYSSCSNAHGATTLTKPAVKCLSP